MSSVKPPVILVILALLAVQILFGLNYVISKVVVDAFPPLVWASIRIVIATAVMFGAAILFRRPHPEKNAKFFGPMVIFALLGCVINQSSFLIGLHYTTPTNSAILNTLIPIFTLLIVTVRGQEPVTLRRVIGFLFAFAGVLVLRKIENFSISDQTAVGDLLTMVNCLSYSFFLSYGKSFFQRYDRVWATAYMFLYGSVGLGLLAVPDWTVFVPPLMTQQLLWCATFAVVGGTLLTYFLNNWALAYAKPSHVAIFVYIQPAIAAVLAWFWFGEPITARTLMASGFIFTGVILATRKR